MGTHFFRKNPNLNIPNSGLLMMREKSTMEVIKQRGKAGKLSMLETDRHLKTERALGSMGSSKRKVMIEQMKHNLHR